MPAPAPDCGRVAELACQQDVTALAATASVETTQHLRRPARAVHHERTHGFGPVVGMGRHDRSRHAGCLRRRRTGAPERRQRVRDEVFVGGQQRKRLDTGNKELIRSHQSSSVSRPLLALPGVVRSNSNRVGGNCLDGCIAISPALRPGGSTVQLMDSDDPAVERRPIVRFTATDMVVLGFVRFDRSTRTIFAHLVRADHAFPCGICGWRQPGKN